MAKTFEVFSASVHTGLKAGLSMARELGEGSGERLRSIPNFLTDIISQPQLRKRFTRHDHGSAEGAEGVDARDEEFEHIAPEDVSEATMQSRMSDDFESWLRASDNVVKIPDPSPEMDEKVFLAAYPTLRCPLITMPIDGGQAAAAGGVDGSTSSSSDFADFAARIVGLGNTTQESNAQRLQRRHLRAVEAIVTKTVRDLKRDRTRDQIYYASLKAFLQEISDKGVRVLSDQVSDTYADLYKLFLKILDRTRSAAAMGPGASTTASSTGDLRPALFAKLLEAAAKEDRDDDLRTVDARSIAATQANGRVNEALVHQLRRVFLRPHEARVVALAEAAKKAGVDGKTQELQEAEAALRAAKGRLDQLQQTAEPQAAREIAYKELQAHLSLLDANPTYNEQSFSGIGFQVWKVQEAAEVHAILASLDPKAFELYRLEQQTRAKEAGSICIKIIEARNLMGKDKTGLSDPYVTIEVGNEYFETDVQTQTLNPVWQQQIVIPAKELGGKITLNVWDKDEEEKSINPLSKKFWKEETDDFLGTITFDVQMVLNRGYEPWEDWFPLQKRSKRSNVSGDIHLLIMNVPAQSTEKDLVAAQAAAQPFQDYHGMYLYLMRALMKHDYMNKSDAIKGDLTARSRDILREFAARYRISRAYRRIARLAMLTVGYRSVGADLKLLGESLAECQRMLRDQSDAATDDAIRIFSLCEQMLYRDMLAQLARYHDCFRPGLLGGGFGRDAIKKVIKLITSISKDKYYLERVSNASVDVRKTIIAQLKEAILVRYRRLVEESSPDSHQPIIKLQNMVTNMMDAIDEQQEFFETDILDALGISVTSLFTKECTKYLVLELELLAAEGEIPPNSTIGQVFDLFHTLRAFQEQYLLTHDSDDEEENEDAGVQSWDELQRLFTIETWFTPFVSIWLRISREKLLSWVQQAILQDTGAPVNANDLTTTSVLDVYSACLQSYDTLKSLKISDKVKEAQYCTEFSATISEAAQLYARLNFEQMRSNFAALSSNQPEKRSFFSRESKAANPFELSRASCYRLNNIQELVRHLNGGLYELMNVEALAETLREHAPASQEAPKRPGTLTGVIKVHLLRAVGLKAMDSNGRSDPYVVIKSGDKVIGRSNVIFATLNPTWDEHFECHVTDCAEALIQVYDYDRLSADDLCGEAILPLAGQADGVNDISDGHVYERVIQLTPMGQVFLRLQFEAGNALDIRYQFSFAFRALKRTAGDMAVLIVEQMVPYLRECIRKHLDGARPAKMRLLSKAKADGEVTQQDLVGLEPIMQYLSNNLVVLSQGMTKDNARLMLKHTWNAVLREYRLYILPPAEGAAVGAAFIHASKTPEITPKQLAIVQRSVAELKDMLYADGDGLSKKYLEGSSYQRITSLLDWYTMPTPDLIRKHMDLPAGDGSKLDLSNTEYFDAGELLIDILDRRTDKDARQYVYDFRAVRSVERKWRA